MVLVDGSHRDSSILHSRWDVRIHKLTGHHSAMVDMYHMRSQKTENDLQVDRYHMQTSENHAYCEEDYPLDDKYRRQSHWKGAAVVGKCRKQSHWKCAVVVDRCRKLKSEMLVVGDKCRMQRSVMKKKDGRYRRQKNASCHEGDGYRTRQMQEEWGYDRRDCDRRQNWRSHRDGEAANDAT